VTKLKENFIYDSFVLSRLKPGQIERLQFPIGLESELKQFINSERPASPPRSAATAQTPNEPAHHHHGSSRKRRSRTFAAAAAGDKSSSILGLTPESVRLIKESWKLTTSNKEATADVR